MNFFIVNELLGINCPTGMKCNVCSENDKFSTRPYEFTYISTCLYEGCNSMRSFGTGHLGFGFSGRANVSGLSISYALPQPGSKHFSLSKATH